MDYVIHHKNGFWSLRYILISKLLHIFSLFVRRTVYNCVVKLVDIFTKKNNLIPSTIISLLSRENFERDEEKY